MECTVLNNRKGYLGFCRLLPEEEGFGEVLIMSEGMHCVLLDQIS
jgi:hypothetical protein